MPDMEKEIMGESREWIDAGSGELGRLFVEVLECKGLPNLDSGGLVGNLTDSFVSSRCSSQKCLVACDIYF